jgi:hypothetical protein
MTATAGQRGFFDTDERLFPNEDNIVRLIGAGLLEANNVRQVQRRYMQIEGMAELYAPAAETQSLIPYN